MTSRLYEFAFCNDCLLTTITRWHRATDSRNPLVRREINLSSNGMSLSFTNNKKEKEIWGKKRTRQKKKRKKEKKR